MKQIAWVFIILLAVTTVLFAVDALTIDADGTIKVRVHGSDRTLESIVPPVGAIEAYGGVADPSTGGWLICDGRALSSADYSALYAVIGTSFGNGSTDGDGNPASGDFNLPDMRGRFARGLDTTDIGQEPRDPDRATRVVGSFQDDAFQGHWHHERGAIRGTGSNGQGSNSRAAITLPADQANRRIGDPVADESGTPPRTSSETRPDNVAVNYIIKY